MTKEPRQKKNSKPAYRPRSGMVEVGVLDQHLTDLESLFGRYESAVKKVKQANVAAVWIDGVQKFPDGTKKLREYLVALRTGIDKLGLLDE